MKTLLLPRIAASIIAFLLLTGCGSSEGGKVIITSGGKIIDTVHSGQSKEFYLGQRDGKAPVKEDLEQQELTEPELFKGYVYSLDNNSITHFKYSREFRGNEGDYVTEYRIYNPQTGVESINITAHHYRSTKRVIVQAHYTSGILPEINTEETYYSQPSDSWFGKNGTMRALGGNNIPAQIAVKFFDDKYQHVVVKDIAGSHVNGMWDKFFVLKDN